VKYLILLLALFVSTPGFSAPLAETDGPVQIKSIGGFAIIDYHGFFPDKDHVEMTSGAAGRAIRLEVQGSAWEKWTFRTQVDFAGDAVRVRHAWLQYNYADNGGIRIGQQTFGYGLESASSSPDLLLAERAMFHRAWGVRHVKAVVWNHRGEGWLSSLGLLGEEESRNFNPDNSFILNWRGVWQPIQDEDNLIHFGVVANRTSYKNDAEVQFRVNPAGESMSGNNQVRLIDTGVIADRDYLDRGGIEFVSAVNNFALLAEYNEARVARTSGDPVRFQGHYVHFLWLMTGESFPYNPSTGTIGSMKPNQNFETEDGWGAFGLSLRYDHLDLDDGAIEGGKETDLSVGLLWWPNPNIKFVAQYTKAQTEKSGVSDDPSLVQLRAQVVF
jgi:phosphate-selective porin OprO/OprP